MMQNPPKMLLLDWLDMKKIGLMILSCLFICSAEAEDGYRLWLRYDKIANSQILQQYVSTISSIRCVGNSPTLQAATAELLNGLEGLLGKRIATVTSNESVLVAKSGSLPALFKVTSADLEKLGEEGFLIRTNNNGETNKIIIAANTDIGLLYGVFHFLRTLQTNQNIQNLAIVSIPKIKCRILNHWDNLNRTVERGYAGISIWDWHKLPDYLDQRYTDYARANASIGINGTVLTNVNANALILTRNYLGKVAAIAGVLRPYGMKVYLTARFSAPIEIGGLKTADPLDQQVQEWWKKKIDTIYQYVPDFGGFLVKANSEGQPGPQNYGRTHADGANMLGDALAAHNGIVMWRAFVYSNEIPDDRVKQAYNEFQPLDGKFRKNVLVQVKNGPLDFQPREPFHPLFGAMPQTPLMMEFQLTQEYLGQATHLVYQAPLYKECLDAETYAKKQGNSSTQSGSTVADVIDGSMEGHPISGIAGVANIGNDRNWTGHPFGQANWYAFGRLAWDHTIPASQIADEWIKQTFTNDQNFIAPVKKMMFTSREAVVNYMTPLGLHHIMATGHHYGPGPWVNNAGRADWNPVYYHKADSSGIGFNRTSGGSDAIAQYAVNARKQFEDINTIPDQYLLWFHHVRWNHTMKSGRTLWTELCYKYNEGVDSVRSMQKAWNGLSNYIDKERHTQVKMLLNIQQKESVWWRDACLSYFQTHSRMPIPANFEQPQYPVEYYKAIRSLFAPGIGGNP
jgi:alpha-glucuronidase